MDRKDLIGCKFQKEEAPKFKKLMESLGMNWGTSQMNRNWYFIDEDMVRHSDLENPGHQYNSFREITYYEIVNEERDKSLINWKEVEEFIIEITKRYG